MVDRMDESRIDRCADCGADLEADAVSPSYALDDELVVCHVCAVRRGGVWDELDDRWTKAPDLSDLARLVRTR